MAKGIKSLRGILMSTAIALGILCGVLAPTGTVFAQNKALPRTGAIEEIIVTVQKREENLQDVPVSAQVVADQLGDQNILSLTDLSLYLPGVSIQPVGRSNDVYFRGIGSGNNPSFRQSGGIFFDGVYRPRSRSSSVPFLDVNRVEVMRGPQSTFFGNSAIAGAINVISNKPTADYDFARALYGEYGQYSLESAMGFQPSQRFAIRVAATANGQDGYLRNVPSGDDQPNEDSVAGRVMLQFDPNQDLSILVKAEASTYDQDGGLVQQLVNCPAPSFPTTGFCALGLSLGVPTGLADKRNAFDPGQGAELDSKEGVITVNYQLNSRNKLISETAYNDYKYVLRAAADATPMALLTATVPETADQFSQEFRITSETGGTWEYLAGVYYLDEDLSVQQQSNFFFLTPVIQNTPAFAGIAPFAPLGQLIAFTMPSKTYSVFGSLSYSPNSKAKLSIGLRGSYVETDISQTLAYGTATQTYAGVVPLPAALQGTAANLGLGVPGSQQQSRDDDAITPSARFQYNWMPDVMTYVSYTRGFKPGGFNGVDTTGNPANLPFDEETVDAYEIGLKSRPIDSLVVNLTAFRSEYDNLQVVANSFGANGAIISAVRNAASAISQGAEIELRWSPIPAFRVALEGMYLDAYYDSYPNAGSTQAQQLAGIRVQDLSGQPTSLAPEWSSSLVSAYTVPFGANFDLTAEVTAIYSTDFFLTGSGANDPLLREDGYTRLDARLALEVGNFLTLSLVGKNLTDEDIFVSASPQPTSLGSVLAHTQMPRNVALQAFYTF